MQSACSIADTVLMLATTSGFNFVRHHSHVLPPEYFSAADEWGIMVSPELPCAYSNYFKAANATGQQLYLDSWASYIAALRNHPSIFDWTLLNEYYMGAAFEVDGQKFGAGSFYAIKQELDPSRLMNDQDGSCRGTAAFVRDTLSFCSQPFNVGELGCIGYNKAGACLGGDLPFKYHDTCTNDSSTSHACSYNTVPMLPIISHETGNYVSDSCPRLSNAAQFMYTTL